MALPVLTFFSNEDVSIEHMRRPWHANMRHLLPGHLVPFYFGLTHILTIDTWHAFPKQNRSPEGCSKLKRSVDTTSPGKNGLSIRINASWAWIISRYFHKYFVYCVCVNLHFFLYNFRGDHHTCQLSPAHPHCGRHSQCQNQKRVRSVHNHFICSEITQDYMHHCGHIKWSLSKSEKGTFSLYAIPLVVKSEYVYNSDKS